MIAADLSSELTAAVGDDHVLLSDELRAPFETDWTGRFTGRACAVVRPASTSEVSRVVEACSRHGVAIVPQGGNTGLVGGSTPRNGELVISMTRLDQLEGVDPATMQIEAGAGVTLARLQEAARPAGLDAGLDLGARDSATLGGLVACDAGGTNAVRYGTAANRITGVEAVLADGSVIRRMSGLLKDNAGYDLPALLAGSEGTLGLITAVRWRLAPAGSPRVAALVGLRSLAEAADVVARIRPRLAGLEACDFFTDRCLELVRDHLRTAAPLDSEHSAYLLLEVAGSGELLSALADSLENVPPENVVIAESSGERARLWRLREAISEAIAVAGIPHKLDVGVPLDRLAEFADRVGEIVADESPRTSAYLFGHLGDGNVHVNLLGPGPEEEGPDDRILGLAAELGGTVSAEHGIGIAKARQLTLTRSPADVAAMRAIKRALDPDARLNPGAVLPPESG